MGSVKGLARSDELTEYFKPDTPVTLTEHTFNIFSFAACNYTLLIQSYCCQHHFLARQLDTLSYLSSPTQHKVNNQLVSIAEYLAAKEQYIFSSGVCGGQNKA